MDCAVYLLTQALHQGQADPGNQVVSAFCAACSWVGNNMGWPALLGGSVLSCVGAGAMARADGSASGSSASLGYKSRSHSVPASESYTLQQYTQLFPDLRAAPVSDPIDTALQALVKHLQRK